MTKNRKKYFTEKRGMLSAYPSYGDGVWVLGDIFIKNHQKVHLR